MALSIDIPAGNRIANYHRVEVGKIVYSPDSAVENSKGSVVIAVRGYENQEAHVSGQPSITDKGFRIFFGDSVSDYYYPKGGTGIIDDPDGAIRLVTIKSNEPIRSEIYAAVKQMPDFIGAVDA